VGKQVAGPPMPPYAPRTAECQLRLINCTDFPATKELSPGLLEVAREQTGQGNLLADGDDTLLSYLDPTTATADELREAFCRDIDPKGLKALLDKLTEKNPKGKKQKIPEESKVSVRTVLVILGIVSVHIFLMVCICCGVKKTCWTCRKARKGLKQVSNVRYCHWG